MVRIEIFPEVQTLGVVVDVTLEQFSLERAFSVGIHFGHQVPIYHMHY